MNIIFVFFFLEGMRACLLNSNAKHAMKICCLITVPCGKNIKSVNNAPCNRSSFLWCVGIEKHIDGHNWPLP